MLVIHVGRQVPEKNHARLMRIFAEIAARIPQARLLLAGKRENLIETEMTEIAKAHGILERIVFGGVRKDIGRLLAAADVMIFPSLREGLPGAVVEASAAGIPIVASAIPGIAELCVKLPGLICLKLAQSDTDWANCAIEAMQSQAGNDARRRAFPSLLDLHCSKVKFENVYLQGQKLRNLSGRSR